MKLELKENDKAWIRETIKEELCKALTRTITIERGPRNPGDKERHIRDEEHNILDFFIWYIPYLEGALRGLQADTDKYRNRINELLEMEAKTQKALEATAKIMLGYENSIKILVAFSEKVKAVASDAKLIKLIGQDHESNIG